MAMQYDVSSVQLNQSGFGYNGRTRLKGLVVSSDSTGGVVVIFDTTTSPVTATYGQSGTVVTVTKVAHGLKTGDRVGISFSVGTTGSATDGNYTITRTGADTFTLIDFNSSTITPGAACVYVAGFPNGSSQWHASFDFDTAGTTNIVIPGEGLLVETSLYINMTTTHITSVTAFLG